MLGDGGAAAPLTANYVIGPETWPGFSPRSATDMQAARDLDSEAQSDRVVGVAARLDRDPAGVGECVDPCLAAEATVAGVLDAAERGLGLVADGLVVDVDDPGPDRRSRR
jgi:hypothetical protein